MVAALVTAHFLKEISGCLFSAERKEREMGLFHTRQPQSLQFPTRTPHWPKPARSHDKAITVLACSDQCAGQRGELALQGHSGENRFA